MDESPFDQVTGFNLPRLNHGVLRLRHINTVTTRPRLRASSRRKVASVYNDSAEPFSFHSKGQAP